MKCTLHFTESQKKEKLKQWGWQPINSFEEEVYQNVVIEVFQKELWHNGNEKIKVELDFAFSLELSERLLKIL